MSSFDILFVGGLLQPGGSIKAPAETEDIKEFVEVGATHSLPNHCALTIPHCGAALFDLTTTTPRGVRGPRMPTQGSLSKQTNFPHARLIVPGGRPGITNTRPRPSSRKHTPPPPSTAPTPPRNPLANLCSYLSSSNTIPSALKVPVPSTSPTAASRCPSRTASVQWATAFHDALYAMRDEDTEDDACSD
ncbi:hypothetical protein BJY52DRAFT_1198615 [Lactarius psammicola]|nr:hypothetical protein BJY52DRAFT_1198615 [Lactarius psammicola]